MKQGHNFVCIRQTITRTGEGWVEQELADRTEGSDRPRMLISIGRSPGSGSLGEVYAAGRHTFYDELITCAGGTNAYSGYDIPYPALSVEGLMALNPGIIIDLIPDLKERGLDEADVRSEWAQIPKIDAVKNGRVHVITSDYAVIPGPRFILFLEDLARILHPELFDSTERPPNPRSLSPVPGAREVAATPVVTCPRYGGRCHEVTEWGFYPDASIGEFFD